MAEYTTMQIAALVEKSERQVQRWIKDGKLKAEHISGNRYEVDESDIEPFLPRAMTDSLVARIEALEGRMSELEGMVRRPEKSREVQIKSTDHLSATYHIGEPGQDIPPGSVPFAEFAERHGVPRGTFRDHLVKKLTPCITRPKPNKPHEVERWLSPEHQAAAIRFWREYGTVSVLCDECPHHE